MCVAGKSPYPSLIPDLVLWCLHADPSAKGHLASLPQLNQTYYPNQMKKVAPFDYCLDPLSAPIGEFHVGSMWLSCQTLGVVEGNSLLLQFIPQVSGRGCPSTLSRTLPHWHIFTIHCVPSCKCLMHACMVSSSLHLLRATRCVCALAHVCSVRVCSVRMLHVC